MSNRDLVPVYDFVDGLVAAGVTDAVISPGSRSTPLTMVMARDGRLRTWSILDERSAAFFALGMARVRERAVVLVCTSGTAAANYLPAVIEAYYSEVPLVVVTADRPQELRGVGANQTVDQLKLYGSHVKGFVEMPVPVDTATLRQHARAMAVRMTVCATTPPRGPVHVNWPFREPLIPPRAMAAEDAHDLPAVVHPGRLVPAPEAVAWVLDTLRAAERPLVVAGPQQDRALAVRLRRWAAREGIPILADPLSQVRTVEGPEDAVIDTYDALLRSPRASSPPPDWILRIGATPVSKVLGQYLANARECQIAVSPAADWRDPWFTVHHVIQAEPLALLEALEQAASDAARPRRQAWFHRWRDHNDRAREAIRLAIRSDDTDRMDLEGRLFLELADVLANDAVLMVGNSMPVRDLDTFFPTLDRRVRILANRGASGIDGVVSTAFGASAGEGGGGVWLVIGDVSLFHDLGALSLAKRLGLTLRILVVHNDGGGIFQFLPQASERDTFNHFRTPHGLDFRPIVEALGGTFHRAGTWAEFREKVGQAANAEGLVVVELRTDPEVNRNRHAAVMRAVQEAVLE